MESYTSNRITVVDSHPGSGKTSYAIQEINKSGEDEKIIYITPFLTEVDRIIDECPKKEFIQPTIDEDSKRNKKKHFLELIVSGKNIVSTHALFINIDNEIIEALHLHEYTLYLDEVFQTVEKYNLLNPNKEIKETKKNKNQNSVKIENDLNSLLNKKFIEVNEDYSVSWIDIDNTLSAYDRIRTLADRNLLYCIDKKFLMWTFPIDVFRKGIFNKIYILTYQFDYQIQAYYYSFFGLEYKKYYATKNEDGIFEIKESSVNQQEDIEWKNEIKNKIHILENSKLNNVGAVYYNSRNQAYKSALSLSWYEDKKEHNLSMIFVIRRNMINYYTNILKSKTTARLWTSFKEYSKLLASKNISEKYWIALNTRATNNYKDRTDLCYLINRYLDPSYEKFFIKKGITIDQDKYAVSELIQWVWRSAIREGNDIYIYIPSQRMRELLKKFLNNEELVF